MAAALAVNHLWKSFGSGLRPAVRDVSFAAAPGEIIVLLGPSGCGKTTTLRMVAGLEQPTDGTILIGTEAAYDSKQRINVAPQHRQIGMVFQSYAVWPHMSVAKNVAYPLARRGLGRAEIARKVEEALALVGLEDYLDRSVSSLSGGQMQRVALARALVYEPRIILLDEPLSNLDAKLRLRLRDDLRTIIKKLGLTALYVTHDQEEAVVIGDRIGVMKDGELLQMSAAADLYNRPADAFVAHFTGVTNMLQGRVRSRSGGTASIELSGGAGPILATLGKDVADGEAVSVGIRPENIRLLDTPPSSLEPDQHRARVVERRFHGGQSVYRVAVLGTELDVVELGTMPRFDQGHEVTLTLPADLCWSFPAEASTDRRIEAV
ncbi:ABC transporter ATP-binding protein [Enterovirga rhinocerotis]|uniref:Iron(III) transport system ATP-binding protein n=1 Tax=Enterovirga rhinocerotis TaxID=1339210 RepID=A0A4R7BR21_9HYPH|nr:ABC transporter ATP-binding protein [Enterovirga rhinocerotis]TDR88088.1 iron(III) transport system ATP-binding protein [Enterovirga rhinocerotis]